MPLDTVDHKLICLPEVAMAKMGLDPAKEVRVLCNRAPSISLTSIQPVRAVSWQHLAVGISPRLIANMQGDFDGDEISVWVMPEGCIREAEARIECPRAELKEYDRLGSADVESYSIAKGLGPALAGLFTEMPPGVNVFVKTGVVEQGYAAGFCFSGGAECGVKGAGLTDQSLSKLFHVLNPSPIEQRTDLSLQKSLQGSIGSDTRLMRLALTNLVCDSAGNLVLGRRLICRVPPGVCEGHVGLRLSIRVGYLYQQAMLDSHKLKALGSSADHLAESIVAPRFRLVGSSPNVIIIGWPRLSDLRNWLPSSSTPGMFVSLAEGLPDMLESEPRPSEAVDHLAAFQLDRELIRRSRGQAKWKLLRTGMVVCSVPRQASRAELEKANKWLYGATTTESCRRRPRALLTALVLRLEGDCSPADLACLEAAVRTGLVQTNLSWAGVDDCGKTIMDVLELNIATATSELESYQCSDSSTLNGAVMLGRMDRLISFVSGSVQPPVARPEDMASSSALRSEASSSSRDSPVQATFGRRPDSPDSSSSSDSD